MQLSDREIQNTLDLLKTQKLMDEKRVSSLSKEEITEINQMIEGLGGAPEVRADKVEKLRRALESSSYNVTNDDVAKKMIGRIFSDKLR